MYKFSNLSMERLKGVDQRLVKVLLSAIVNSPYDFLITQGLRTTQEQQKLYAQGRTTKGAIVTNCDGVKKKSNHQAKANNKGYAVDIAVYDTTKKGNIDYSSSYKYEEIARHILTVAKGQGVKVVWGGNWKTFKDLPHFELID